MVRSRSISPMFRLLIIITVVPFVFYAIGNFREILNIVFLLFRFTLYFVLPIVLIYFILNNRSRIKELENEVFQLTYKMGPSIDK